MSSDSASLVEADTTKWYTDKPTILELSFPELGGTCIEIPFPASAGFFLRFKDFSSSERVDDPAKLFDHALQNSRLVHKQISPPAVEPEFPEEDSTPHAPSGETTVNHTRRGGVGAPAAPATPLGRFRRLTTSVSLKTDRYLNKVLPSQWTKVNTLWRVEQLISILLPYLDHLTLIDFICMSRPVYNAASKAIVRVTSSSRKDTEPDTDASKLHQRYFDENFSYSQYRYLDEKTDKSLISVVLLSEGVKGSYERNRMKRNASGTGTRIKQLARAFSLVTSLEEECVTASTEYRSHISSWILDRMCDSLRKSKRLDAVTTLQAKAPDLQAHRSSTAVGIRSLVCFGLLCFSPDLITTTALAEFSTLQRLSVFECPMFTFQSFPGQYHEVDAILNSISRRSVLLDWDFAVPYRSADFDKNLRKSRALGAMVWRTRWVDTSAATIEAPFLTGQQAWLYNVVNSLSKAFSTTSLFQLAYHPPFLGFRRLHRHIESFLGREAEQGRPELIRRTIQQQANLKQDPTLLSWIFTWSTRRNEFIDSNSNDVRLFPCAACGIELPGIFFEDAQVKLAKRDESGICLGCKWLDMETAALESHAFSDRQAFIDSFVVNMCPKSIEDWLQLVTLHKPKASPPVQVEDEDEVLAKEFCKICPLSLTGKQCTSTCQMAVAKFFPTWKELPETASREHPWIRQVCRKWLLNPLSCDAFTLGNDDEHMRLFSHDISLEPYYKQSAFPKSDKYALHRAHRFNPKWDPESSVGTEPAFLQEVESTAPPPLPSDEGYNSDNPY